MKRFCFTWFLCTACFVCTTCLLPCCSQQDESPFVSTYDTVQKIWTPPDTSAIPKNKTGNLIRYGRSLIINTANYLGPKGTVAQISNGMNCQNCHINAGTMPFANPFSAVASTYPKYRERSGRVETVAFRINECMERSLNGRALDSNSREVKAMEAYFQWLDYGVPKGVKPEGAGTQELHFLNRPADPIAGERVFTANCQRCHGREGKGVLSANAGSYIYPPLWGSNSYNVSAGMYRLTKLAGFIKNNMPFGVTYKTPQLTDEEAWDVAAYICAQPRPATTFSYDWPKVATKPVDYPFKPYADSFSEQQHKYGPFGPITAARKKNNPVK